MHFVPKMTRVESSALAAVGYDEPRRELFVRFTSGALYVYTGVEPDVHEQLLAAESKGHFYGERIRDRYPFRRLD